MRDCVQDYETVITGRCMLRSISRINPASAAKLSSASLLQGGATNSCWEIDQALSVPPVASCVSRISAFQLCREFSGYRANPLVRSHGDFRLVHGCWTFHPVIH
jgi:hypothetical protein